MLGASLALGLPPATAWVLDSFGLSLAIGNLVVALAVMLGAIGWSLRGSTARASLGATEGVRLAGALAVFAAVVAIDLGLAWPSLLPIAISDATLHWLLADYIYRHAALVHGWDELAQLGELTKTPFGASFLVAASAQATGLTPLQLLHPVAALLAGAMALFAYAAAGEWAGVRASTTAASLAVLPLFLWPADYTVGQLTRDFFLPQTMAMACMLGLWYWLLRYRRQPDAIGLLGMAALAVGALFSYPTLLPPFPLAFAIAVLIARRTWRERLRDAAAVAAPMLVVALGYLADPDRRDVAAQILRQGGVTIEPSLASLPPLFLLLGGFGLIVATLDRGRRAASAFVWLTLLQAAALDAIVSSSEAVAPYHYDKLFFLIAPELAVCGAVALAMVSGRRALTWAALLLLGSVVAWSWQDALPRFAPLSGARAPLTPQQVALAAWARANLGDQPIAVLGPNDITQYWLEIGLLGHERASWRLRRVLPVDQDGVRAWRQDPAMPPLLLVPTRAGTIVPPDVDVLRREGDAAILGRR
jgi:hypothetical protein